jgi:hypothetical protein
MPKKLNKAMDVVSVFDLTKKVSLRDGLKHVSLTLLDKNPSAFALIKACSSRTKTLHSLIEQTSRSELVRHHSSLSWL